MDEAQVVSSRSGSDKEERGAGEGGCVSEGGVCVCVCVWRGGRGGERGA